MGLAGTIGFAASNNSIFKPVEPVVVNEQMKPIVELGKMLWFDPRLSRSGFISCNSCHNLSTGGVDNLKTSVGDYWAQGPINSPTVLNAEHQIAQFWDGRAKDLKEQAGGPIENPLEMASSHEIAVNVIDSIPGYKPYFKKAFGTDKVTIEEITEAIAAFEHTLVTPNSPFDKYLKGDEKALTDQEKKGLELFKTSGCIMCHNGPLLGGNSFQKMGVVRPYETTNTAQGVAGISKKDQDRMNFKVPTLRNVELTYPYFHDGEAGNLATAVRIMGELQLGRTYTKEEIADIVAWLKTLTGELPEIVIPTLPVSVDATPEFNPWAPKKDKE
ncbi:MAG: cytochrome-c peroxidase [Burkholderiales bacterium]|nr:cytochrome-c peroxidase [Burkholderiales bacterium]